MFYRYNTVPKDLDMFNLEDHHAAVRDALERFVSEDTNLFEDTIYAMANREACNTNITIPPDPVSCTADVQERLMGVYHRLVYKYHTFHYNPDTHQSAKSSEGLDVQAMVEATKVEVSRITKHVVPVEDDAVAISGDDMGTVMHVLRTGKNFEVTFAACTEKYIQHMDGDGVDDAVMVELAELCKGRMYGECDVSYVAAPLYWLDVHAVMFHILAKLNALLSKRQVDIYRGVHPVTIDVVTAHRRYEEVYGVLHGKVVR